MNDTTVKFATGTVARPVSLQAPPISINGTSTNTGTLGHTGVVEYSKSSAAVVRETYVVSAVKKR